MIPVQTLLVQTLDGAIHRINHYPADTYLIGKPIKLSRWIVIYPVDSAIQRLNDRSQVVTSFLKENLHWFNAFVRF